MTTKINSLELGHLNFLFYEFIFEDEIEKKFSSAFLEWAEKLKQDGKTSAEIKSFLSQVLVSPDWKAQLAATENMSLTQEDLNKLIRNAASAHGYL